MAFGVRQANLALAYRIALILSGLNSPFLLSILVCGDISSNPCPVSMAGRTGLFVLYFNAFLLVNKTVFLKAQLALKGCENVVVTESHLDDSILNAELLPPNNVFYCKDRNKKGGVCFWL